MGEFFEPEGDSPPKVFTQQFFDNLIKKGIENGEIGQDDKLVFVAAADEVGAKAIVAVQIIDREKIKIKMDGIFQHDWSGDNKIGGRILFTVK